MADKELAAKLAKRLAFTGEESEQQLGGAAPPPAPVMPQKIVENPYVASDPSFSVDDLILKTLEVREENNNYQTSLNSPPSPSPASPSKSPLPPKQTIRDWILKDQPQPVNAIPKNPILPVEHHKPGVKKAPSPEDDGSELERKLAAQRAKKSAAEAVKEEESGLQKASGTEESTVVKLDTVVPVPVEVQKTENSTTHQPAESVKEQEKGPVLPEETKDSTRCSAPEPVESEKEKVLTEAKKPREHVPSTEETPAKMEEEKDSTKPSSSRTEMRKTSFEELEEQMQKEVEEEERRKAEEQKVPPKPPRALEETITASPTAQKKQFVPSPLLMEAIRQECGIKSPPPPTAPKPQTPTNSRPQSPVVSKKAFVSPLGLLCDPLMSIETPSSPKPQSPKPVKKIPEENPEELEKLLERQRKINDGDAVPQFVNRKMSLYTEFSEFTRKQIKSLTETFKKYDEDGDGFIDFMELKRMMEKLGEAQTHIALKEIIKKVDEDQDGKINLREFFLLFRLAAKGELVGCSEVFNQLAESIDVSKEGVLAAASFFQAKIAEQTKLSKFEEEIKQEQDEKKREEEEKRARREKFQQSRNLFH